MSFLRAAPKVRMVEETFDTVASDEIRDLRAAIHAAADAALVKAGAAAAIGDARTAADLLTDARVLRSHALTIPLDMVEANIDLRQHGTIMQFE